MTPREATAMFVAVLARNGVDYIVVGSIASMFYGEPRTTQDVDLVVRLREADVDPLLAEFPEPEFYVSREAAIHTAKFGGQFNIIHVASGFKADLVKARSGPFEQEQFDRSRRVELLPGVTAQVASPEHVILAKLLFYDEGKSDKHLRDIAGILRAQGPAVDRAYIDLWADRFDVAHHWRAVQERAGMR